MRDETVVSAAAISGVAEVRSTVVDPGRPAEAYAPALASALAESGVDVLVATSDPAGRVILGAAAAALDVPVVTGVLGLSVEAEGLSVERRVLGGKALQRLVAPGPLALVFGGDDVASTASPVEAAPTGAVASDITVTGSTTRGSTANALRDAAVVVSFGRGVRSRDDIALVESLATALGGEIGCSMPIADDFGWVAKDHYVGRSGQHIAPRLYVAIGISGAPQHLEGIRDAHVVVAINSDPDAAIFERADYGIAGDLYEVVPALTAALR